MRPRTVLAPAVLTSFVALPAAAAAQTDQEFDLQEDYDRFARRVVERDSFPVFDDPKMKTVEEAKGQRFVQDTDLVIGIAHGGEAKAYPVPIMGVHELGNDTIGGKPVAVSW